MWNNNTMREEVTIPEEFIIEFTEKEHVMNLVMPVVIFLKNKTKNYVTKVYECPEYAQEGYFTAWVFRPKQGFKEGINREYAKVKKILVRAKANRKTFKNDL